MKDIIFTPKYPFQIYLAGIAVLPSAEVFLLASIFFDILSGLWVLILAAFLGFLCVYFPYRIITRVIFNEDTFTIEKILYPAKTFLYADVVDIGHTVIRTRKEDIPLTIMGNPGELYGIFISLVKKGKINQEQLENTTRKKESAQTLALMPSMIISPVLWWITVRYVPFENTLLGKLSFFVFFIPIYLLAYYFFVNHISIDKKK